MDVSCKQCGSKWVVNKTHMLCNNCNYKRTHGGQTQIEVSLEKQLTKSLKEVGSQIIKIETCVKCNLDQVENKTHKLCHKCNIERIHKVPYKEYTQAKVTKQLEHDRQKEKESPTPKIKQVSPNNKNVSKDSVFFRSIWASRPHVSEVSGQELGDEYSAYYHSHILTKGAYPKFRHNPDNIKLVTRAEHDHWETGDRDILRKDPRWNWVFEREEKLIRLYYDKS